MIRKNVVLDLTGNPGVVETLGALLAPCRKVRTERIACTVTKHRLSKAAIVLGIRALLTRKPDTIVKLVAEYAPIKTRLPRSIESHKKTLKPVTLVLECSSTPIIFDGVEQAWRKISGVVSRRRVTKTALCLGLELMTRTEHKKIRSLVSKVCPVKTKYWDDEVGAWL